ncbi:SRPBCC domain-containing protein [Actinopolymorpha sp. NPDC004070]|uniref:SRPBCC domain-containing protein n=1 Tax=Actinopolymorpha sp. NPDC004070 TaxID=3154548 RepID=UPI0033A03EE4
MTVDQPAAPTSASPVDPYDGRRRRRRWPYALLAVLAVLAGGAVGQRAHPVVLRTEVEIAASPDQVWTVLADRAAYPEWNPFIVRSSGRLQVGQKVTNVHRIGGKTMVFKPTVLAVQPGHELRWIGRLLVPGIFDGEHSFTLTQTAPGRTHLVQQETFKGIAVPFTAGWLRGDTLSGFRALNTALRDRVESRYR